MGRAARLHAAALSSCPARDPQTRAFAHSNIIMHLADDFGWANAVSSTPLSSAPASAPRRGSAPHPRAAAGLAPP